MYDYSGLSCIPNNVSKAMECAETGNAYLTYDNMSMYHFICIEHRGT